MKEDVAEMKSHRKRDNKEKKKKKKKRSTEADADIEKKGAKEVQLSGAYGEELRGGVTDSAEPNRKRREKNKNKNNRLEMGSTEQVEGNDSLKSLEGDSVSGMKSDKVATKERKNNVGKGGENAGKDVGTHSEKCKINVVEMVEGKKRKGEKKKRKDDKSKTDDDSTTNKMVMVDKEQKDEISEKADRKKRKKKKVMKENDEDDLSSLQQENVEENVEGKRDGNASPSNKPEKKEKVYKDHSSVVQQGISMAVDSDGLLHTDEMQRSNELESAIKVKKKGAKIVEDDSDNEAKHSKKGKKKKIKSVENGSHKIQDSEVEHSEKGGKKRTKLMENGSNDLTPNKSNKKVRFSTEKGNDKEDILVRGKWYTPEEDEIIEESIFEYIEDHDLGDEGLNMVLESKNYPELRGCWKEIGSAIPYRPYRSTYYRAQVLFRRSEDRKWTKEEYEKILKHHQEHGNKWKGLAEELGKHSKHVRNTWGRIKFQNLKKGKWMQEEYEKLFDLVNADLQMRVYEEKRSQHGMLRDNIRWSAISDQLSTRTQSKCCTKWYGQLTSPMVTQGVWHDTDDYRLLGALYCLDATCMEDVDWDDLIDGRTGDVCRKRWNQMVLHIGHHRHKSFAEHVDVLAQRYCPHLLEAREAWDSKPRVP